jgi:transposase InsO family protein
VSAFIAEHRGRFGVEPICRTLGVSASAYYQRATGARSARAVEDEWLVEKILAIHAANYYAYGSRRMWKALTDRVWRTRSQLELAIVEYVGWFNSARLHGALDDLPPAEFEALSTIPNQTITFTI